MRNTGKRLDLDDDEVRILTEVIEDDIETAEAYQAHLESEGDHECLLFGAPSEGVMSSMMTGAIEREEVLKRIKGKLEGGGQT